MRNVMADKLHNAEFFKYTLACYTVTEEILNERSNHCRVRLR